VIRSLTLEFWCSRLLIAAFWNTSTIIYEEKEGGRKWHMEQRPLSNEIVKSGMVHWIDPRFNGLLFIEAYYHYPFLQPPPVDRAPKGLMGRVKRKVRRIQGAGNSFLLRGLNAHATNAIFRASFFLHFASMMEQMRLVRQRPNVWWDILTYNA